VSAALGPAALEPAVVGIDLGSSEVKVGVFALDGRALGMAHVACPMQQLARGRFEQDPGCWWAAVAEAAMSAVREAGSGIRPIAISVAAQGPTTVAVDTQGRPVRPAIGWMDTRASAERTDLETELGVDAWRLGTLPHERWLRAHEPEAYRGARWFLTAWDWLGLRLSGVAAASTQAGQSAVSAELVRAAGSDPRQHPSVASQGQVLGTLGGEAATQLGLPSGLPVVAGTNDGLASLLGGGMLEPGDAIDTGGTSGGFAVVWDSVPDGTGAAVWPSVVANRWVLGGAMSSTGKAFDWLAGLLDGDPRDLAGLAHEALSVAPGADGLVFLPYLAGERSPIWDDEARGVFAGLRLDHGRAHLARAVLEAAALAVRHVAEPIRARGVEVREMRVSGPAAASPDLAQLTADVIGLPVAVPRVAESAALGAAILAAVGVGSYPDLPSAMRGMCSEVAHLHPREEFRAVYDELYDIYRALYPATVPLLHRLARLDTKETRA
jgi:xylulokinase